MVRFIDDGDMKKYFPLPFAIDSSRLYAVINMTQVTKMRDLLGDSLYDYVLAFFADGEPDDSDVNSIYDELKLLHCMHTAEALYSVYYTDDDTSNRDFAIDYISSNTKLLETSLVTMIQNNSNLATIAGQATVNTFDSEVANLDIIYYE